MLLAAGILALAAGQQGPSVEADGEDIKFTGQNFYVQRTENGRPAGAPAMLATEDDLDAAIEEAGITASSYTENVRLGLAAENSELRASLLTVTAELSAMSSRYAAEVPAVMDSVQALASALDVRLPPSNMTCGAFPALDHGAAAGHHDHISVGAVRTLSCATGFSLAGSSPTVVCNADGVWSDQGRARCVPRPTDAPTPAPTDCPYEIVSCCAGGDNGFRAAYADGVQLATTFGGQGRRVGNFRFPSNSRVLGLKMYEGECGCMCGWAMVACSTPSGEGPWNFVGPGPGGEHDHLSVSPRWSGFTVPTIGRGSPNPNPAWASAGGNFSLPSFDPAANNFVAPLEKWPSSDIYRGLGFNSTQGCPRIQRAKAFCSSDSQWDRSPRRYMDWYFRYDSRADN